MKIGKGTGNFLIDHSFVSKFSNGSNKEAYARHFLDCNSAAQNSRNPYSSYWFLDPYPHLCGCNPCTKLELKPYSQCKRKW
ncbi:hypothetical protein P872_19565 [Rhodonellum psychrophilum GCM71 = DSM 17998]|uniref:Uncharacterized protein n=1 Tax=Rhodonellum psychrophilum GCM71 = DSM 17998 TaxID=1123057 RepID=U5C0I6_9BACT|nr:hypothetical protein P872_19565 [Rhodonellum psychrophilum GCM71 = DSM 17998]